MEMKIIFLLHCLVVAIWGAELSPDLGLGFRWVHDALFVCCLLLDQHIGSLTTSQFSQAPIGGTVSD